MTLRVERVVTSGTFSLDGGNWDVDNNVWLVGDDSEVVVIDAAHSADPIVAAVGGRTVRGIVCTHGHNDHVTVAPELSERLDAPILLHPADRPLWTLTHSEAPDGDLADGETLQVAGTDIHVIHTPGHAPGGCCFYVPELGVLFSGDTLFNGGPGATGRSYSDRDTLVDSIRTRLFTLPDETVVKTGHGDDTTIGAEKAALGLG